MATLKGTVTTRINQAGADESGNSGAVTAFGLPGSGGIPASMSSVHLTVLAAVYDDLSVYIGLSGAISDPVVASYYPSEFVCSPHDWNWRYSGGELVGPSEVSARWTERVDANSGSASRAPSWASGKTADEVRGYSGSGWYVWDFSNQGAPQTIVGSPSQVNGLHRAGLLTDYGAGTDATDGVMYVSGTGTYSVDDPIYPNPMRVVIPGFLQYLDYFPFAVNKGNWASCNRNGGFTQQWSGSAWQNRKNVAASSGSNHAWYWNGSSWVVCPEIGEK